MAIYKEPGLTRRIISTANPPGLSRGEKTQADGLAASFSRHTTYWSWGSLPLSYHLAYLGCSLKPQLAPGHPPKEAVDAGRPRGLPELG